MESGIQAAAREAMEEVGVDLGEAYSTLMIKTNKERWLPARMAGQQEDPR